MSNRSISSLAYTIDGGLWTPITADLPALQTNEPIAAAVFRHRLYLLARESTSGTIRMTSTSDLRIWAPWAQVPSPGLQSGSTLAAATLAGKLFIFNVFKTGKRPAVVIMGNSTSDGVNWSGWLEIEAGLYPEGARPPIIRWTSPRRRSTGVSTSLRVGYRPLQTRSTRGPRIRTELQRGC